MPVTKTLHVIAPVYNEDEATLMQLASRLEATLAAQDVSYQVFLIDDGSAEPTIAALDAVVRRFRHFHMVRLSRNFGHQAAISAGMMFADADAAVLMDSDLQDPPEALADLISWWRQGCHVVYAVRKNRKESLLKRASYYLFYRALHLLADIPIPVDSGDFCLMDRKVVDVLRALPEHCRFHRGLRTWVGFRQKAVVVERGRRYGGDPKIGGLRLYEMAVNGLISFSIKPLRVATLIGLLELFGSALYGAWIILGKLRGESVIQGWTSLTLITLFSTGIIIFILGVIGEYIGLIFMEAKGRPSFVIADVVHHDAAGADPLRSAPTGDGGHG